ncbi:membrane protein [Jannaschia pagri]|uniref:Membrane protein n=1 Tax=Jannaschia pagri TaxID=2829797 RepID=A0ABQ4NN62_9RHOB|nr:MULTISPECIES: OpgC domain-containing protein [unclassified Jannaschia]GIT92024.1 membrane protein [Jannaschia sp. AI_61]GIT95858.1 membrane protein [Jannaschia sp. AI_62]
MTTTSPPAAFATAPTVARTSPAATVRDPRLDFFRGIAMFIILLAHTPGNAWTLWIPARFGFSDATEIFVFCSGMASAIAFGRSFDRAGWTLGTARVGFRVWQIYWAHIGMFFAIAGMLAAIDATGWHEKTYINTLNLVPFFEGVVRGGEVVSTTADQMLGLLTLSYVPNYFDILPMYMVVLILMPVYMALARVSLPALAVVVVGMWVMAQDSLMTWLGLGHLHLAFPAEPWSERTWFFNPFGWQLLFFTGFAFMRGWIPAPPVKPWLLGLALAVVIVSFFLSSVGFRLFQTDLVRDAYIAMTGCTETAFGRCNPVFDWRQANKAWFDKSDHAILHYVHFLALAYLAWAAAGDGGRRLIATGQGLAARIWDEVVTIVMKVGQQSLAVFIFSMVLARVNGYLLDIIGRSAGTWALINLTGFGLLIACAYGAGWFKSQPWRVKK